MKVEEMDIGECKITLQTLLKKDVRFRNSEENLTIVKLQGRIADITGEKIY